MGTLSVTLPLLTLLPTTARGRPRLRPMLMLMLSTLPTATTLPTPLPLLSLLPLLPLLCLFAHAVTETVKHACREVTTEHCVDNPKVIEVPVEVEHCHTVTKVTCADVENKLPKTTCEAVVTSATSHAVAPA